jgi:hypothetical protein
MCHRCATARRHSFPVSEISHHSNCEPACAVRCTRRTPPVGVVLHAGSAKPRTQARRHRFKRWRLSDIRRRPRLPGHISGGRTHASYALIPRIGSKEPWPVASVDFTKREAGVVRVTCIITRLSPWSRTGTIRSACALVLVSSNWRRCDGPYIATAVLQDLNPQRGSRSEDAGDGESSRRCLTAAGASRFSLTGRSRRDSIHGTGRHRPDKQPAQVVEHLHGPNPQHGECHVSG